MIALSVNLNKIALIRNSRPGNYPDVVAHAETCISSGVHGLTVHPRSDQRHIRPDDVVQLHKLAKQHANIELNIEGNPFLKKTNGYPGFVSLVCANPPTQCTLVPDTDHQLTSDHGFDLKKDGKNLEPIIRDLRALGIRVSLFLDPDIEQISRAADIGVERIELYTGPFAQAYSHNAQSRKTMDYYNLHCSASIHAHSLGLGVNAGHDLNLQNLVLYRKVPHLMEVSIGHALVVDAISIGLTNSVRAYLDILNHE